MRQNSRVVCATDPRLLGHSMVVRLKVRRRGRHQKQKVVEVGVCVDDRLGFRFIRGLGCRWCHLFDVLFFFSFFCLDPDFCSLQGLWPGMPFLSLLLFLDRPVGSVFLSFFVALFSFLCLVIPKANARGGSLQELFFCLQAVFSD